jgi:hypothetical protein
MRFSWNQGLSVSSFYGRLWGWKTIVNLSREIIESLGYEKRFRKMVKLGFALREHVES